MANQLHLTLLTFTSLFLLSLSLLTLYSSDQPLLTTLNSLLTTLNTKLKSNPNPNPNPTSKLYIVYVEPPTSNHTNLKDHHLSFLPSTNPRLLYSYKHSLNGFSAYLTPQELDSIRSRPGFVHAHPAVRRRTHTTYTPWFVGLNEGRPSFWDATNYGEGQVVGVVDYGIDPTHISFDDYGIASPPSKWKGGCFGDGSYCNNKLVGAVGFYDGQKVDASDYTDGHGTNCASTAAGNFVEGASVLGQASGTASGSAPKAHVAMYKACHGEDGCVDPDIAASVDQAIEDGVDVLSMSLGANALPFYNDLVAIGAYSAMARGIFMSLSVGNSGPSANTVENHAPWILTVGASTMDRTLSANVVLGSGSNQAKPFVGESAYQPSAGSTDWLPLVYPGTGGDTAKMFCVEGSLDGLDVKGKAVVCHNGGEPDEVGKGRVVKNAGGAAMIVLNQKSEQFTTPAKAHVLPVSHINYDDAVKLQEYVKKSPSPVAKIVYEGTKFGVSPAPAVASFSGRGPNSKNGGILKPDIIGPGHNILVATPLVVGPKGLGSNVSRFDIQMGTSIATPLLAGVAALIKNKHPDWSPAAIKSAIMTTADILDHQGNPITDETGNPANLYALGAGHVSPVKANDPGLVYDLKPDDYIPYLCGLSGYNDKRVQAVTGKKNACTTGTKISAEELNYPSIALTVKLGESNRKLTRTVTNVGLASETYRVSIDQPNGIQVRVEPESLVFSKVGEQLKYVVYVSSVDSSVKKGSVSEGHLTWVSQKHSVRSPISVKISN